MIWPFQKGFSFNVKANSQPFIIGVSGSVAVGKSTTSRLLQILLSRTLTDATVELVTTDGFLYPNQTLLTRDFKSQGISWSYDMKLFSTSWITSKWTRCRYSCLFSWSLRHRTWGKAERQKLLIFVIVEGIKCLSKSTKRAVSISLTSLTFPSMLMLQSMTSRVWYLDRFLKNPKSSAKWRW